MNTGRVLVVVIALLLVNGGEPPAGPLSVQQPAPSALSAAPSQVHGRVTDGQVVPDKGELPPAPELTPEERERLLRGTMRKVPTTPSSNADCPSPPVR